MGALLDDMAVLHDEDDVRVPNRGETVCNDEACPPLHELVKRILHEQLCTGIDAGGRFIEDQHRRVAEHDTGDTEKLLLALR